MVDQDMLFRSGLMLVVLFLAGLFGASIARRISDDSATSLDEVSDSLADIIHILHYSDPGSQLMISFGDNEGIDTPSISFPSKIDDRTYTVEILPGMVVLEMGKKKEIVIADDFIVPCYSPEGSFDLNKNLSRKIAKLSGGFRVETPNSLVFKVPNGSNDGEIFIFPASITNDGSLKDYRDIVDLLLEPDELVPGWIRMVNISTDRIHSFEGSLLLLSPMLDHTLSGSCNIPVYLPPTMEIGHIGPHDHQQLTIYKKAVLHPDGYIEIKCGVKSDLDHNLP